MAVPGVPDQEKRVPSPMARLVGGSVIAIVGRIGIVGSLRNGFDPPFASRWDGFIFRTFFIGFTRVTSISVSVVSSCSCPQLRWSESEKKPEDKKRQYQRNGYTN
jgi:hypothetical protein